MCYSLLLIDRVGSSRLKRHVLFLSGSHSDWKQNLFPNIVVVLECFCLQGILLPNNNDLPSLMGGSLFVRRLVRCVCVLIIVLISLLLILTMARWAHPRECGDFICKWQDILSASVTTSPRGPANPFVNLACRFVRYTFFCFGFSTKQNRRDSFTFIVVCPPD